MLDFPNHPNFRILEKLGEGAFGAAYKVLNKEDNSTYVIKKISKKNSKEEEIKNIKKEADIFATIESENIVKYYDSFIDNESFNIIMEDCNGLDLRKFITSHEKLNDFIEKDEIYYIILEICKGLKDIHDKNLIHRDLKPDNIFLNSDVRIKIGDFGIERQLKIENEYAKTQAGAMLYMAPEIINGEKYNSKVEMWALGCIIHELCTLKVCFQSNTIEGLKKNIKGCKHEKINIEQYGQGMQNLIDSLLSTNYKNRPNIDEVIKVVKNKVKSFDEIAELFQKDIVYQNYFFETNILNSIDQVEDIIYSRENKFYQAKYFIGGALITVPLSILATIFTGGIILPFILSIGAGLFSGFTMKKILKPEEKVKFLRENKIIIYKIQTNIAQILAEKLNENILKEKIIIYNKKNFHDKIKEIKNKLFETKFIKKFQEMITKKFNILLVGCTNSGKSTLINEFLDLKDGKKAGESTGGPTDTEDFKPYIGINKNKNYILYDTNGITNMGVDSIGLKYKNTTMQIEKRLKSRDPNELIHCIWYCLQGSNVQPSDKLFIESLLKIYTTYTIPIIYIHTQTYSKQQSNTCKMGIEKYLNEIFKNDKSKVNEQLNNYINILARGDEDEGKEAFGLEELEKLSQKEIEEKGIRSSYFEYIKQSIIPVLINGIFSLIFTNYNINKLVNNSKENIENLLETMLSIVNNDKLGLTQDIKNKNKDSLKKLSNRFKNIRNELKNDLMELLSMSKLKSDNKNFIKNLYDKRSSNYKKELSYKEFTELVENLIYDNFENNKEEIINNILNQGFIFFNLEIIKEGVGEQFKEFEKEILTEIYTEIFKELNKY